MYLCLVSVQIYSFVVCNTGVLCFFEYVIQVCLLGLKRSLVWMKVFFDSAMPGQKTDYDALNRFLIYFAYSNGGLLGHSWSNYPDVRTYMQHVIFGLQTKIFQQAFCSLLLNYLDGLTFSILVNIRNNYKQWRKLFIFCCIKLFKHCTSCSVIPNEKLRQFDCNVRNITIMNKYS